MSAKVLVVDDDSRIVGLLARLLSSHGYEVLAANNGVDAFHIAIAEQPDLVISDVLLPRLNGFDLLKRIRESERLAAVKVIMISAVYRSQRYRAESMSLGADEMLCKPFDPAALVETVAGLVPPPKRLQDDQGDLLQQQVELSQEVFAQELPATIRSLQQCWQELCEGSATAAYEMHDVVHRLIGTGATLGFHAVAEVAQRLQSQVAALAEGGRCPNEQEQRRIDSLIRELEAASTEPPDAVRFASVVQERPGGQRAAGGRGTGCERVVYVVDDDPAVTRHLALQLEGSGYTVRCFSSPVELRAAISAAAPAVVLMDVLLPEGEPSKRSVISDVREQLGPDTRVAFMSARADLQARLQAVRAGGEGYFTKPLDISALTQTLDRFTETDSGPSRVLVVEDDQASAMLYAATLRRAGIETVTVADPLSIMGPLVELQPDLILLDMYMPGCTGPELAAVIRQEPAFIATPILFLSAEEDASKQLHAMTMGGDGFLHKSVKPEQLAAVVRSRIVRARAVRSQIVRDGLTGSLNRARLLKHLKIEVERARRLKTEMGLTLIDVDLFSRINETHGYYSGDRVLKALALFLRQRLRVTDIIGRVGGDELAVIMPAAGEQQVVARVDEMRNHFAGIAQQGQDGIFHVTFSAAVAGYPRYSTAAALLEAAGTTLTTARQQGGNVILVAGSDGSIG